MKIKARGQLIIGVLVIGALVAGYNVYQKRPQKVQGSSEIGRVNLPPVEASLDNKAAKLPLPSKEPSSITGLNIDWKIMAWNAQFALMYANGDSTTMKGSLIEKAGLHINIIRQDNCDKTTADLVKFAQDYKSGAATTGVFATFMGDGMPGYLKGLANELAPLGPEYQPMIFYPMGKSFGEDKLMGPPEWKTNPKAAIGKTIACVIRDGDMNIALKWAGDNGIQVNPDEQAYDPTKINLIAAQDFLDAANKYIKDGSSETFKEPHKLVVDGKKTNRDTMIGVDAIATWTPGDVNEATKKGGLVVIASTKQYSTQMAAITVTIRKFANDHRTDIENLIAALGSAGDQVRSFTDAKMLAAKVSARVYNEQDATYWLKYYNGVKQKDIASPPQEVELGGSMAFNLADAATYFGLGKDGLDRYKAVYNTFGNILMKMYPSFFGETQKAGKTIPASFPEYSKIVDKSFLSSVVTNHPELLEGKVLQTKYADQITEKVSSKSVQIQFASGSAKIQASSYAVLNEIFQGAVVAEGLKLGIYGHTDNVGNSESNLMLSDARANSVKDYLVGKGLSARRIEAKGYGDTQPIADNSTAAGKAKNRRVQIDLGD